MSCCTHVCKSVHLCISVCITLIFFISCPLSERQDKYLDISDTTSTVYAAKYTSLFLKLSTKTFALVFIKQFVNDMERRRKIPKWTTTHHNQLNKQITSISTYLSTNRLIHPSILQSVRLSVRPSIRQSVRLSVCPSIRQSVRLSVRPSIHPPVHPSVRQSVQLSVRRSVCLSIDSLVIWTVAILGYYLEGYITPRTSIFYFIM